ncbi:hypothetical protein CPT_Machias_059 [Staphylococcus phage Machias]|nr:hypothetical protein CPT_Machias_059 [Staphylococcus phage Machias]WPH64116.1 hypothetical protein [Staphylococcus phage vB_StaM_PB50]
MLQLVLLCLFIYFLIFSFPLILGYFRITKQLNSLREKLTKIEKETNNQRNLIFRLSKFNEALLEEIKEQEKDRQ